MALSVWDPPPMPRRRIVFINHNRDVRTRTAQALVATGHQIFSFEFAEDALKVMAHADVILVEGTRRPMDDVDFLLRVRTLSTSPVVLCSLSSAEVVRTYGDMIGNLITAAEETELAQLVVDVIASMAPVEPVAEEPIPAPVAEIAVAAGPVPKPKRALLAAFASFLKGQDDDTARDLAGASPA
jgi:hypothetical protein